MQPCALSRTLERVADEHLDAALVTPAIQQRLRRVTDALPAALTNDVYLECRLRAGCDQVDLVLHVDDRGRAILAGTDRVTSLSPGIAAGPVWGRIRRLCREWMSPASPMHAVATGVWLEFDLDAAGGERATLPTPGVFVALARTGAPGDPAGLARMADVALAPLRDAPLPETTRRSLRRCFDALPEPSYLSYVGCFPGRGGDAVRLCIRDLSDDALPAFLARIGWPGDIAEVERRLDTLGARGDAARPISGFLHLDVADGVQPRLCREFAFDRQPQLFGEFREHGFLHGLVAAGLCTPEKRAGLLRWPGHLITELDHELWTSLVFRRLNHVKLVFDGAGAVEAKGYIAVNHRYRPPGGRSVRPGSALPAAPHTALEAR
jgi:hypothetical protein